MLKLKYIRWIKHLAAETHADSVSLGPAVEAVVGEGTSYFAYCLTY